MKAFIHKYHLREGFFVSLLFPVIFFLLNYSATNVLGHFIFSLGITFSFWIINFMLFDFKKTKSTSGIGALKKNLSAFLLSDLMTIAVYISFGNLLSHWGVLVSKERGNWGASPEEWYYLCIKIILLNSVIILIKYLVDISEDKRKIELENEVLKRENLNAMHEALKQQLNPHFLFNSMNTLKSLTKRNPEQAIHFIDKLSEVYRYMLLHQNNHMVTLADEVEFLKSYLYLLKIRFGDAINSEINLPFDKLSYRMPPNTLQPLVENAVKHNIASLKKPLFVSIFLQNDLLVIQNNLQLKAAPLSSSGLGLSNISHRYKLIMGKDISIRKTGDNFIVCLPLN